MPQVVNGTSEQRETFMAKVFRDFYTNPANAGRELSIDKANDAHRKKFGSMLRNKKAYAIRRSVKASLMTPAGVKTGTQPLVQHRHTSAALVEATSKHAAVLLEGTPEQIGWLKTAALDQLGWRVDHATDAYAVLVKT